MTRARRSLLLPAMWAVAVVAFFAVMFYERWVSTRLRPPPAPVAEAVPEAAAPAPAVPAAAKESSAPPSTLNRCVGSGAPVYTSAACPPGTRLEREIAVAAMRSEAPQAREGPRALRSRQAAPPARTGQTRHPPQRIRQPVVGATTRRANAPRTRRSRAERRAAVRAARAAPGCLRDCRDRRPGPLALALRGPFARLRPLSPAAAQGRTAPATAGFPGQDRTLMLQSLRDKTSGWIAPAILVLLIVPFAFFGVENYFQQSVATHVAKVGDKEIGQDEFRARFEEFRNQMRQAMGENFDAREFESAENKRRVLDRLIDEELLRQAAERLGVTISPQHMQREIAKIPAFQIEGRFDPETYRMVLTSQGMTPRGFEDRVRRDMLLEALPSQLVATGFVTGDYVSRYLALRDQTRTFSWVELPQPAAESIGEITDADVQAWFDQHPDQYVSPETVALEYVEIDAAKIEVPVVADEQSLRERYEEQKARYIEAEQRLASHILVKVAPDADADAVKAAQAKAADLTAQARAAGADFAALAKQHSEDPGSKNTGGDLGWVEKGIFEPAFETALFAMQANAISDPVKTAEGWHVIQLREIKAETGKPFEEVRAELEKEYLDGERERIVSDLAGKLVDVVYRDPSTLATASSELDLPIQKTAAFTRAGGAGIAANPKVVEAAFSEQVLVDAQASDPIEIAPGHQVVIRAAEHVPAAPRKLEDVREAVRAAIVADRMGKAAKAAADAALADLQGGKTLADYAAEKQLEVKTADAVGRAGATADPTVLRRVFELPHPAEGKPTLGLADRTGDRYALVSLTAVQDGDPTKTEARSPHRDARAALAGPGRRRGQRLRAGVAQEHADRGGRRAHVVLRKRRIGTRRALAFQRRFRAR